ncbi:hypothetical protein N1F89_03675 [Aquibium sp. A9E412]|uniref:hypothetical protein n=1 Tax=Aquibium sp. A9E412 TaxID=2976767 RepID=UPI0025B233F0|nr:hypothetical protein [Aquibium sp. A9E412]MDN2565310.1 hypothetical protein [Aquibium sp. A9E412]
MTCRKPSRARCTGAAVAALLAALAAAPPAAAQMAEEPPAETIVGSEIETKTARPAAERADLIAAVAEAEAVANSVRKAFSLDQVEIVFLDMSGKADLDLQQALSDSEAGIEALRRAIEGNAMFYHAVDSRGLAVDDIVAVSFLDRNHVRIYATGAPPGE